MVCRFCSKVLTTMASESAGACAACIAEQRDRCRDREHRIDAARAKVVAAAKAWARGSDIPSEFVELGDALLAALAQLERIESEAERHASPERDPP